MKKFIQLAKKNDSKFISLKIKVPIKFPNFFFFFFFFFLPEIALVLKEFKKHSANSLFSFVIIVIIIVILFISLFIVLFLVDRTVQPGTLLIDSSTIDPNVSKEMAALAVKKGAVFMDAPVSGG